jgi:hypothetical protein
MSRRALQPFAHAATAVTMGLLLVAILMMLLLAVG